MQAPLEAAPPPAPGSSRPAPFVTIEGVPWEDLTEHVRLTQGLPASPFAGDPGYEAFFDALSRALHRHSARHVVLIREKGVGEQTVLAEFARRAVQANPPFLRDKRICFTDLRRIPQESVRRAMDVLFSSVAAAEHLVVAVEGFARLLQDHCGPHECFSVTMAALSSIRCRIIGILTPHEFEALLAEDGDAHELFTIIHLHEPDAPVATRLLTHVCQGLGEQYQVQIAEKAVAQAVSLSANYVLHERLPLKAIKILRSICDDVAYNRTQKNLEKQEVLESDVIEKVAQMTGIPGSTLAGVGDNADYFSSLREIIVGQDHAVKEVATELGLIKAGLVDAGKPATVLFFAGQTGTGKTQMAKALARLYSPSQRLKTFTLGNFSEPHSVSGIIGVPPGYVGHDQGGRLINDLNAEPYSVFLLDEADKAHPDVMQPFLNLFDEGWIADQRGVRAYADRAIFILTTNVGQRQIAELCKKGKSIEEITATMKESLNKIRHSKSNRPVFTAEFLARVKRFIVFRSLDGDAMRGIASKLTRDLAQDWSIKRQKRLDVPDELIDAIARRAHALDAKSQGKEGGRIVRRLLADLVEAKVQAAISRDTAAYRAAKVVRLAYLPATETGPAAQVDADAVTVNFEEDPVLAA